MNDYLNKSGYFRYAFHPLNVLVIILVFIVFIIFKKLLKWVIFLQHKSELSSTKYVNPYLKLDLTIMV